MVNKEPNKRFSFHKKIQTMIFLTSAQEYMKIILYNHSHKMNH